MGTSHSSVRWTPRAVAAAFVAVLVLASSVPFLLSIDGSLDRSNQGLPNEDNYLDGTVGKSGRPGAWNWAGMADGSGFVGVIVMLTAHQEGADALEEIVSGIADEHKVQLGLDSESALTTFVEKIQAGVRHKFSNAFEGFSARLDVESVKTLEAANGSFILYPDLPVHIFATPSNYVQIGADQVWSQTDSSGDAVIGTGITVAVIDTGVDYTHPDLGGGFGPSFKVTGGYDFYNYDSDPMDDNGHGTHIAGIIAANGVSYKGVAPGAKILAYKALNSEGSGSMSKIIEAIDRAMDPNGDGDESDHADIVSMSLGGDGDEFDPLCLAVKNAVQAGIVVVAAAGNEGPEFGTVSSPGIAPDAITVGAIDGVGKLASFSSRGIDGSFDIKPDICAPGVNISSTVPRTGAAISSSTGYKILSGTSMATPHVSGAAALLLQLHPDWTPAQVRSAIVTGAKELAESIWQAGSGQVWVPTSADASLFVSDPLPSIEMAGGPSMSLDVSNRGSACTLAATSTDWMSLASNGSMVDHRWMNLSSLSPLSLSVAPNGQSTAALSVSPAPADTLGGYYDGVIHLSDSTRDIRIPFGYTTLSRLNVHVLDMAGQEVYDFDGGVWIYSIPDISVNLVIRGYTEPAPPASFILSPGNYSVHAAGHQAFYRYTDPYILSGVVNLAPAQIADTYLRMSSARQLTLDLESDSGSPIFVKNFKFYYRYQGLENTSFHLTSSDYNTAGSDLFYLPRSRTLYVSDTDVTIGISIAGVSYSSGMWDFMSRNWRHWYEFKGSTSTSFIIESTADEEYLLAWEFDGIGSSVPSVLTLVNGLYSVYTTKYDIPGAIGKVWNNAGTHLSMGGLSYFYLRRNTGTSINAFFSGLTKKTYVQGVYTSLYNPGDLYGIMFNREFYSTDYSQLVDSASTPDVFLPDREFLTPLKSTIVTDRVGTGPFYPSVQTENTNDTLVLLHPLLSDQVGCKIEGARSSVPTMSVSRDGILLSVHDLIEYLYRPDAVRKESLTRSGFYTVKIDYAPGSQVSSNTVTILGFRVPSLDANPPRMVGLTMPQRFVPGEALNLSFTVSDGSAIGNVQASWRSSASAAWQALSIQSPRAGLYEAKIQTLFTTEAVDLKLNISDSYGNYLDYYTANASVKQIPVVFTLQVAPAEVEYMDTDATIIVTGRLTDLGGKPLSSTGAVPLELMLDGRKVATILDEYVATGSHTHNGSIRFEWHFNPVKLFSGPNQVADINVSFDLGIYQPVNRTIRLSSIESKNAPPKIVLERPANNSLIASGTLIDLAITDDGTVSAYANLDGAYSQALYSPWQVSTASWSDGHHVLEIVATDNLMGTSRAYFEFELDALPPSVMILYPAESSRIPANSILTASVSDTHAFTVTYSADGGAPLPLNDPYSVNMSGWSAGHHTVTIVASDGVNHRTSRSVSFDISSSDIALTINGSDSDGVVRSGYTMELSVIGPGVISYRWSEADVWHELGSQNSISTVGWTEGVHSLAINATSDLGAWDEVQTALVVDDTIPTAALVSPANGSFVNPSDTILIEITDRNLASTSWTIDGLQDSSSSSSISISMAQYLADGPFSVNLVVIDKAGNEVREEFAFKMDAAPPLLAILNLVSGEVAMLGSVLDVVVSDYFLTQVKWSLDDGQHLSLPAPYDIDTSLFSVGWHSLQISADDASGKHSLLTVSFYLDSVGPIIGSLSSTSFVIGRDFDIRADVSDDYGVGSVSVCYELRDGSYAEVPMTPDGGTFVAVLPADVLWDGMDVYVACQDVAGNSAFGPHVQLVATSQRSGLGLGFLSSLSGIAIMCAAAMISSISMLYVSKRRGRDEEIEPEMLVHDGGPKPTIRQEPASRPRPPPRTPTIAESSARVQTARIERKLAEPRPARDPIEELEDLINDEPPTLIDSIPEIVIKNEGQEEQEAPVTDYGDLIERELLIPGLKNSVFKDEMKDLNSEIEHQLEELRAMIRDKPKNPLE